MTPLRSLFIALLFAASGIVSLSLSASAAAGPQEALQAYLRAMYARDADTAYTLVSEMDRGEKTLEDYRAETGRYDGAALALSRALANAIRFGDMSVKVEGNRASVTFEAWLPDANAPELEAVVQDFDKARLATLPSDELAGRIDRVRELAASDALPLIHSTEERWDLVREEGEWRVFVNWAGAVEVRFEAVVMGDLGWEFTPVRERVLAKPGETIEMAYRVRNTGTRETTGKARHIVGPSIDARFLEIVSCFCFLETTLKPGEETELPLVFRVDFDAPEAVRRFSVRYEFFPPARFPGGAAG